MQLRFEVEIVSSQGILTDGSRVFIIRQTDYLTKALLTTDWRKLAHH